MLVENSVRSFATREFKSVERFDANGALATNPDSVDVPTPRIHEPNGTARQLQPGEITQ